MNKKAVKGYFLFTLLGLVSLALSLLGGEIIDGLAKAMAGVFIIVAFIAYFSEHSQH